MRAQNKNLGPKRIPSQSIGIFRHVHWEEDSPHPYIRDQKAEWDGQEWLIRRTIQWIVKWVRRTADTAIPMTVHMLTS